MTENTKHFIVTANGSNNSYDTMDKAVVQAKRFVADHRRNGYDTYNIYALVATVTAPLPEAVVTEVK